MTPSAVTAPLRRLSRSSRAPRWTSAPAAVTAAAAVSERARPTTSCPASSRSRTTAEPMYPVAPVTKTRICQILSGWFGSLHCSPCSIVLRLDAAAAIAPLAEPAPLFESRRVSRGPVDGLRPEQSRRLDRAAVRLTSLREERLHGGGDAPRLRRVPVRVALCELRRDDRDDLVRFVALAGETLGLRPQQGQVLDRGSEKAGVCDSAVAGNDDFRVETLQLFDDMGPVAGVHVDVVGREEGKDRVEPILDKIACEHDALRRQDDRLVSS